jgi:hypothetical protein
MVLMEDLFDARKSIHSAEMQWGYPPHHRAIWILCFVALFPGKAKKKQTVP